MPQTILTPNDWIVEIVYVGWHGREVKRLIGVSPSAATEKDALRAALESLRKRGQLPPEIKDMNARRRSSIGIEKTINRDVRLIEKFVKGRD